jgi:hypothetical protein
VIVFAQAMAMWRAVARILYGATPSFAAVQVL